MEQQLGRCIFYGPDYFDNIFCFIKAEGVQSNHQLLDPKITFSNNGKI